MTKSTLSQRPLATSIFTAALILLSVAVLGFTFWQSGANPKEWGANLTGPSCRTDQTNIQISAGGSGEIWNQLMRSEAFQSCCNSATQCIVGESICLNTGQLNAAQSVICAGTNQGPAVFRCSWQNDGKILQAANGTKYCCSVTQNAAGQNVSRFLTDLSSCSDGATVATNALPTPTLPSSEPRPLPRGPGECGARGGNGCTASLESGENALGEGGDLSCANRSICVQCAPGTSWVGGLIGSCLPAQTCRTTAVGGDGCTFRVNKTEEQIGSQNAYGCSGLRNYCVACVEGNGWNGIGCVALQADGTVPCATGLRWSTTQLACIVPPLNENPEVVDCTTAKDDRCICGQKLVEAQKGVQINPADLPASTSVSVESMFSNGGSENIPVLCNAPKYLATGDPTWFLQYFRWQEKNADPRGWYQGSEIFSQVYNPIILEPILAVLAKSKQDGDTELQQKTEAWLKAYWALSALGTAEGNVKKLIGHIHGQTEDLGSNSSRFQGVTQVLPSARTLPSFYITFTNHVLLTFALDYLPRSYVHNLAADRSGSPIRMAFNIAGIPVSSDVTAPATDVGTRTVPAATFGLTEDERTKLKRFITQGDNFAEISRMVGNFRPLVPITFYKTTNGLMSWFGTWDGGQDGFNPNGNKAAVMAVRFTNDGQADILYPHTATREGSKERGSVGRDGQRVCATAEGVTDCLDLPTGTVKYVVEWSRNGLRMIQGDPGNPGGGGGGPERPTPEIDLQ